MVDLDDLLRARPPTLVRAPPAFDGTLAEFFSICVLPNLPTAERTHSFQKLLQSHFRIDKPSYLLRRVGSNLDRLRPYQSNSGDRILFSDNSPAWWIHAFLLSDLEFPNSSEVFFNSIPRHMHHARLRTSLSKSEFHLAHMTSVNNRDTAWQYWDRIELQRRMVLNVHPWNWFLVAKSDWRTHGGRADFVAFMDRAYRIRYGAEYENWRSNFPLPPAEQSDPGYAYPAKKGLTETSDVGTGAGTDAGTSKVIRRPMVRRDWRGRGILLDIRVSQGNFRIDHDTLLRWVLINKQIEKTRSWSDNGLYSWPSVPRDMLVFLEANKLA